ncbi:proline/glycine betaine ABC transporter permease [Nitratireductor rhodophyticola]|uniref:Glycine betaine/proline transport system permease protein n=2 Tax=Nitratireductor TaxID=245876 RepID=A0A1H4IKX9_9HYPH|nr:MULTISPECIES: proline/glycine betaine ABC transporter permease [Nitratireductor]MBY8915029.1 proline/glycine betaine ABC transporter permease [Nitratireductor rhodophyticola]MEC9243316.1 proline/glycine betaine ABC transporter permease [Pseudomonadota bacterium]MBY8919901.1 proline/glycine betaine ABC transporter permease [Nitratireductor rhodophyticola]WPZ13861.1 proline/glycine betaine ABC transporter permease [Nitratireductor rhodophyticola]SEB34670.1 glycine betaine/proline transport sy
MISPADLVQIPLDDWVNSFVRDFLVPNFRPFFRAMQTPVTAVLGWLDAFFHWLPMLVFTAGLTLIAWRTAGRGVAIFTLVALAFIDMIGLWPETMTTLSMIITSVLFCAIIGIPLGIWSARSDRVLFVVRPILDIMQTIPSFVYLVPIVMLFGVGMVPGIIATIIFALPPIIRLTNLGIRNVRGDLIEAAEAFGSTRWQMLWEVQFPLALRTIMAGLNQTLMLALSMVVIAALIGAGGLGLTVYTGLGRLNVGAATAGGIGIVLLAIILDRITQSLGEKKAVQSPSLWQTLRSMFALGKPGDEEKAGKAA